MGMYDTIKCFYRPLPGKAQPGIKSFQSKDLDCNLDNYQIASDGQFLKEGKPCDYTGWLNFYTSEHKNFLLYWYEYNAKFVDGKLVQIDLEQIYSCPPGGEPTYLEQYMWALNPRTKELKEVNTLPIGWVYVFRDTSVADHCREQLALYAPCACGSGKKYKWCCK